MTTFYQMCKGQDITSFMSFGYAQQSVCDQVLCVFNGVKGPDKFDQKPKVESRQTKGWTMKTNTVLSMVNLSTWPMPA